MAETKPAAFSMESYAIERFSYEQTNAEKNELNMTFTPTGLYNEKTGVFSLRVVFRLMEGNPQTPEDLRQIILTDLTAHFVFTEQLTIDKLPTYFYRNAIAIVFPYIRAFISTLSLQANSKIKPLIIPVMNMMALEKDLKDNTSIQNDSH